MFTSPPFLYAMVILSWSTSWMPLSWQASAVPPEVGVFHRFLIATPLMALLAYRAGNRFDFRASDHLAFLGLGLCIFSTNFTLFYYGSIYVASGLLAVAFATASLINILLTALKDKTLPPRFSLLPLALGCLALDWSFCLKSHQGKMALLALLFASLAPCFFQQAM